MPKTPNPAHPQFNQQKPNYIHDGGEYTYQHKTPTAKQYGNYSKPPQPFSAQQQQISTPNYSSQMKKYPSNSKMNVNNSRYAAAYERDP